MNNFYKKPYTPKVFPFAEEIKSRFKKFTQIDDTEIDEALVDLTGDIYFELRHLIRVTLSEAERLIIDGKYCGTVDGKELTEEQIRNIKEVREDFKEFLRDSIETCGKSMLKKQKLGIDRLGIALKPYLPESDGESPN